MTIHNSSIDKFIHANQKRDVLFVEAASHADIIVLFEEWSTKFWQYAEDLLNSSLIQEHLPKVFTVNNDDLGRGHLPGCYVSLNRRNFAPALHRACGYPYVINKYVSERSRMLQEVEPRHLFSFRGNPASYPLRCKLVRVLDSHKDGKISVVTTPFHRHSNQQKKNYVEDVLRSKFVLCPRGASPSSYRLFEVMELGRCPVIISDDWVPIAGIRWEECSIFIPEAQIERIPDILDENEHRAAELGRRAREVWETNFSEPTFFMKMLDMLLHVREGLLAAPVDHRQRWSSWRFNYANGWTIPQRAVKKMQAYARRIRSN